MTSKIDGGPAFPLTVTTDGATGIHKGMSLRDYFAGQALSGWYADNANRGPDLDVARMCYALADAMIAKRGKATP